MTNKRLVRYFFIFLLFGAIPALWLWGLALIKLYKSPDNQKVGWLTNKRTALLAVPFLLAPFLLVPYVNAFLFLVSAILAIAALFIPIARISQLPDSIQIVPHS